MRTNGTIQILALSDKRSFDDAGEPIEIDNNLNWGSPIPSSIKTNSKSNKGKYEDGKFTISTYEILIENTGDVEIERVRLERDGKALGDFVVQDVQILSGVGRIKIIV